MSDNELIAEFMGVPKIIENGITLWDITGSNKAIYGVKEHNLHYRTSWDWLMPVVEKISQYVYESFPDEGPNGETIIKKDCAYPRTFGMIDDEGRFMVRINRSPLCYGDTLLEAIYIAVIDWIKRNNEQPK